MGLKPLEFADCLLDSPYFRENIHEHERELEQTNEAIKGLIKECKALLKATENLSKAQQSFAQVLDNFRFECIGEVETDDEILIADALKEFASVIQVVEEERGRMISHANFQLIQPLEAFRKEQIGGAKEEKKKFDKQTEKFCLTVQNYLNMSSKKKETQLKEADSYLELERRVFHQTALDYVFKLQEVNETKKFQFVETLLSFMYVQMTFFHSGHEAYKDYMDYMTDLQLRLQNTRDRFSATKEQAETLMNKVQQKAQSGELHHQGAHTRQGYLYVQEKRKGGLGYTWTKHYCYYTKENKILTMIPYVQTQGRANACTDTMVITSCVRRMTDSTDRRFCFDITALDRPGTMTLQCLNEEDRKLWLEAMDGKEPDYLDSNQLPVIDDAEKTELGLEFTKKAIAAIEKRGITDQGLYRIVGVGSKVQNVIFKCIEKKKISVIDLESEDCEFEVKTITSALKQHLRNMCPPVFTFDYHDDFLNAVKLETYDKRIEKLKKLIQILPEHNRDMIFLIMTHLKKVAANSNKNLMAASNLGVVFGPTLMKSKEETMAAIMNLKYQSVVIELLIKEYNYIFDIPKEQEINDIQNSQNQIVVEKPNLPPKKPKGKITTNDDTDTNCIDGKPPTSAKAYPAPRPPSRPPYPPRRKQVPSTDSEEDDSSSKSGSSGSLATATVDLGRSSPVNHKKDKIERPGIPPKKPDVFTENENQQNDKPESKPSRHVSVMVQKFSATENENQQNDKPESKPSRHVSVMVQKFSTTENENQQNDKPESKPSRHVSVMVQKFSASDNPGKRGSKNFDGTCKVTRPPRTSPPPLPQSPPPSEPQNVVPPRTPRKARSLYPCVAENSSELSFDAGAVITNVRESKEPGWLEGTISGRTGLIPANYVEYLS